MITRPVSRLVQELDAKSFTVIGGTCYSGLGAEAMHFFRSGLSGAEGDFIAVVGDVTPLGRDPYYQTVARFIDVYADKPVHLLKSNNDGPDFEEYFGHANRAVLTEDFVLVMLDNSDRRFSGETLDFLRETMAMVDSRNVIVSFHVPPPNRISGNTMDAEEWQRFEDAAGVWRNRISLLLCGHDHCYYEDDIDGLRLIVSGGVATAGRVERVARPTNHALEIGFDSPDGRPVIRKRVLDMMMDADGHSDEVHAQLLRAYDLQCRDNVSMRLHAEDAQALGNGNLARFYRAAGESALNQARVLHRLLTGRRSGPEELGFLLEESIVGGVDTDADQAESMLARHALRCVDRTQANTLALLGRIHADADKFGEGYFLCTSCAMLYPGREPPNYCSACGAPYYSLREVK